jgi:hypothetical protein
MHLYTSLLGSRHEAHSELMMVSTSFWPDAHRDPEKISTMALATNLGFRMDVLIVLP